MLSGSMLMRGKRNGKQERQHRLIARGWRWRMNGRQRGDYGNSKQTGGKLQWMTAWGREDTIADGIMEQDRRDRDRRDLASAPR